jgi:Zn-dependent M28 family amino/carboxypeptidase
VRRQEYEFQGDTFANLEVELVGGERPEEVLVVGAHYDTVAGAPGANDNGSGVAALLELATLVSRHTLSRSVRFVAFCNEEPPFFQSDGMGSYVYVSEFPHDRLDIIGMISLETIGYYSEEPGSQKYPPPLNLFYPSKGNFLAFVGNLRSRSLVIESLSLFRRHSRVPSEGIAAPAFIPGVSWSDQWSFWNHGHRAIMVTDTAPYRYPDYHRSSDTPDKIDYGILARVVDGLAHVIVGLANDSDLK